MAEKMYIGATYSKQEAVIENTNITIDNIEDYFTITNGTYTFVWDTNEELWKSNNKGLNSKTAEITLTYTGTSTAQISFDYSYSSEANYDKFTLKVGNTIIENAVSGATTNKSYVGTITNGTQIYFKYAKDSSTHSNNDICTFGNMVLSVQTGTRTIELTDTAKKVGKAYIGVNGIAKKIKKAYIGVNGVAQLCYEGKTYTELEYIATSGTQYIDTLHTGAYKVDCEFEFTTVMTSTLNYVCGAQLSASPWNSNYFRYSGGSSYRKWESNLSSYKMNVAEHTRYHLIGECFSTRDSLVIGNTECFNTARSLAINNHNVYLFCVNNGGSALALSHVKLYYLKMYDESGTLIRDFIPAKRKSDNEIGLYDKVNDDFYVNAGTGTFLYG